MRAIYWLDLALQKFHRFTDLLGTGRANLGEVGVECFGTSIKIPLNVSSLSQVFLFRILILDKNGIFIQQGFNVPECLLYYQLERKV